MTVQQIGNRDGVVNASIGGVNNKTNYSGNTGTDPAAGPDWDNADNLAILRARLTAINAVPYSAAQLNKMTYNDMLYALRVNDFPTGIKQ
jgi:hypothetical protein